MKPRSTPGDRIKEILAQVQALNSSSMASTNKHQQIRVSHWVRKLLSQPTSNPAWLKNVGEHAAVLLQMLQDGVFEEPFTKLPPQGPLSILPRHRVAQLGSKDRRASARRSASPPRRINQPWMHVPLADEDFETRKESKQVQTSEQDDQWEWQRVWKGAFEKLRRELQDKSDESAALAAQVKELRMLVSAHEKAQERVEQERQEVEAKHAAELENLRAVHALELDALRARHRKQLQDATLQNEAQVARARRLTREAERAGAFNAQSDAYGDFLGYIDEFYADTLRLTRSA